MKSTEVQNPRLNLLIISLLPALPTIPPLPALPYNTTIT